MSCLMPRRSNSGELAGFLKQQLPPYMLPAAFVLLDALPLSPNGKLDRRALPTPVYATPRGDTSSPRTATEQQLITLWSELLGVEQVGVDDDFFALGGHSLLAAELMFRLQAALDVDLPLRTIFEAPTIAALAERVDAGRQMQQPSAGLPIRPVARSGELPLSFAQQRYWFLQQLEPHNPVYNVCFAVRLAGQLDLRALEQSLQAVVQRHEALRTTFESRGSAAVQLIHAQQPIAFASVDLSAVPETEREAHAQRLLVAEAQAPVDLRAGPTVRALVLRLHETDHILLLATHHMVFDGSHDIFFRELSALYRVFAHGDITSIARALPELPVQYADFAAWQREQVAGKALDTQLAFWKSQLGGDTSPLQLPTDRPRPPVQTFRGAKQPVAFPARLVDGLRELSRREGVTLFMTVLAGFQALLQRYSGQDLISVGTPVAGRGRAEAQHLIGSFVNTVVLRSDTSGDPSFRELLGRVRRTALEAYAHQDVPFELVVESLQLERDLSRNPLFQVMFVLQPDPLRELSLGELAASPIEVDAATARLDLLLSLWEGEHSLSGAVEYNTDLFDAGTVVRLLGHLQTLLEAVVADPDQRLLDVPILTARGTPPAAGRLERYRRTLRAGHLYAPALRAPGGASAGCNSNDRRSWGVELRRAEPPRQPARASPQHPGGRAGRARSSVHGSLVGNDRGRARHLEGRRRVRPAGGRLSAGARAVDPRIARRARHRHRRSAARRRAARCANNCRCSTMRSASTRRSCLKPASAQRTRRAYGAAPTSIGCRTPIRRHAPLPATWPTSSSPRARPARRRA